MKQYVYAVLSLWMTVAALKAGSAQAQTANVQVGPRPYYLVEQMAPSKLKQRLAACAETRPAPSDFSISHRGAPLQFPEHSLEGYRAAARMGAGILECDVTFTADGELVCRHAQCDLHATTDILQRPELRSKCHVAPQLAADGTLTNPGEVNCSATDLTLTEFEGLCAKMEGANPTASTTTEYVNATPSYRTDLYSSCATLMTHAESIALFSSLGAKFTPELKSVARDREGQPLLSNGGFGASGLDQATYASKLVAEYQAADIAPGNVFLQSFDLNDVLYWVANFPEFAEQAVYLIGRPNMAELPKLRGRGVRILGVPIALLLSVDADGKLVASNYARLARASGLDLIAWTAERSGRMREEVKARGDFYYGALLDAIDGDGAVMEIIHALAVEVGVLGIFSDWPGTVTYYASCMQGDH